MILLVKRYIYIRIYIFLKSNEMYLNMRMLYTYENTLYNRSYKAPFCIR